MNSVIRTVSLSARSKALATVGMMSLVASTIILGSSCTDSSSDNNENRWIGLSVGVRHSCAIRGTGEVVCWGSNRGPVAGTLGQAIPPAGAALSQLATGHFHNCGINKDDSSLICWGDNDAGQSAPPAGAWRQVSAGGEYSCAVKKDDSSVACWGSGTHNRTTAPSGSFLQVGAGTFHACGIRDDSTIACWGYNTSGQANAPDGTFKKLSVGDQHVCAIRTDGSLVCWGDNHYGQTAFPTGKYVDVAAGHYHSCAVRDDHSLVCWGENSSPYGTWYGMARPPDDGEFSLVATGSQGFHSCAITRGGESITCWGSDSDGQASPPASL